jgi:PEP-CTERM motif
MKKCGFVCLVTLAFALSASATLVNLGPGSFTPSAPVITFSEFALGTTNPTYNFTALPGLGNVTVTFAGSFQGQSIVACATCLPGVLTLSGTPNNPLTLGTGTTIITNDGSNPTSPVLSGSPEFNGPISVLFSTPVAGVGLTGGYFDGLNSTSITAFDVNGNALGSITNSTLGLQFYGLADTTGANVISGISFYVTGNEPFGFAIDNLTFGAKADIVPVPSVPEPASVLLMASGLLCVGGLNRRKRKYAM